MTRVLIDQSKTATGMQALVTGLTKKYQITFELQ
jgi:hypothetical protein